MKRPGSFAVVGLWWFTACSVDDTGRGAVPEGVELVSQAQIGEVLPEHVIVERFIGNDGRIFRKQRKLPVVKRTSKTFPEVIRTIEMADGTRVQTTEAPSEPRMRWREMPAERLADLMRQQVFFKGYEYVEESPPLALARKLLDAKPVNGKGKRGGDEGGATRGGQVSGPPNSPPPRSAAAPVDSNRKPRYIVGKDDSRQAFPGNDNWWNAAQMSLRYADPTAGCSGTMISPRVGVTAAHCMYDMSSGCSPNSSTPCTPDPPIRVDFGAHGDTSFFSVSNAQFTIRPMAGFQIGTEENLDFAVIEFDFEYPNYYRTENVELCHPNATVEEHTYDIDAYPGDKAPWPTTWWHFGRLDFVNDAPGSDRFKSNFDLVPGTSGSGAFVRLEGGPGVEDHNCTVPSPGTTAYVSGVVSRGGRTRTCFAWICGSWTYWNWIKGLDGFAIRHIEAGGLFQYP